MIQLKPTKNRSAIIRCLTEPNSDCGGVPPYCASSVHYMLEHNHSWYGLDKPVSISQINRTLRDLFSAGIVVKESRIDDPLADGLPVRVNYWQMAHEIERNKLLAEIRAVLGDAEKAHGTFFFGTDNYFEKPYNSEQKAVVIADIKAMMQRTHPDKVKGFDGEFADLNKALIYCRSTINLLKTPDQRLKVLL